MYLLDIHLHKKAIDAIILLQRNIYFVSADVTFAENESYFKSSTILEQNQTLINRDSSFLPDPNLLSLNPSPKWKDSANMTPEKASPSTPRPMQVYSRRKKTESSPMQTPASSTSPIRPPVSTSKNSTDNPTISESSPGILATNSLDMTHMSSTKPIEATV